MLAWITVIIAITVVPFSSIKSEDTHTGVSQRTESSEQNTQDDYHSQESSFYFVSAGSQGNNDVPEVVAPPKDFCDNNEKPYRWEPFQCAYKGGPVRIQNIQLDSSFFDVISCVEDPDNRGISELDCSVTPFEKQTLSLSCMHHESALEVRLKDKFLPEAGICRILCKRNGDCRRRSHSSACPILEELKRFKVSETGKRFKGIKSGARDFCDPANKNAQIKACIRSYVYLNKKRYCSSYKEEIHRIHRSEKEYYGVGCCLPTAD